jgi:hypothetical protein
MQRSAHAEPPEEDEGPGQASAAGAEPVRSPGWRELPEPLRGRLAELAAAALGKLPTADVPQQLRPVARFAPAKRAKLGGTALLTMLEDAPRFRTAVLEWLREHRPDALNPNAED